MLNQPINLRQPFQHKSLWWDNCTFGRVRKKAVIFCEISANMWSIQGPNFDGFCTNNTTKTKNGTFSLLCGTFQRPKVPIFVFVPLLAQEPSNLGPNGPHIGWDFTKNEAFYIFSHHHNLACPMCQKVHETTCMGNQTLSTESKSNHFPTPTFLNSKAPSPW